MNTTTEKITKPADVEKELVTATNSNDSRPGVKSKLDDKLLKHSHDADAAMQAYQGLEGQVIELTEEKRRALLRKIDWHLMPVRLLCP